MNIKDPEELLRSYDCKLIDNDVYFELKYAVNAMQEYADQTKAETIEKVILEITPFNTMLKGKLDFLITQIKSL